MDPVPRPASLEKIPLETPLFILRNIDPMIPPVAALGVKAPLTIWAKTPGTRWMFRIITPKARMTYRTAIKGTSFSDTCPIRLIPPSSTMATSAAIKMPKIRLALLLGSPFKILKFISAVFTEETMVFT